MPPPEIHLQLTSPSPWVKRFAALVPEGGRVLDVACGGGRHTRFFLDRGCLVTAVDQDTDYVADLCSHIGIEIVTADLENGSPWPFAGRRFDAVVVANYLYRPLFPALIDAVALGGALIYETFAAGNERYARPRNPDHLLRPGELLAAAGAGLQVIAYEYGYQDRPSPKVAERICAVRGEGPWPVCHAGL